MYVIVFSSDAKKDLKLLAKKEPQALKQLFCFESITWILMKSRDADNTGRSGYFVAFQPFSN